METCVLGDRSSELGIDTGGSPARRRRGRPGELRLENGNGSRTYASYIGSQSFDLSFFKRAVREAGENMFCMEFVESDN